jgi:hypothetical protein
MPSVFGAFVGLVFFFVIVIFGGMYCLGKLYGKDNSSDWSKGEDIFFYVWLLFGIYLTFVITGAF